MQLMALGACAALSAPAAADITWRATFWGTASAATRPVEWLAGELAAKTGGQMKIDIVYGQGKPAETVDLLRAGRVEATFVCSSYQGDKMPLTTVLELPMFAPQNTAALAEVELALAEHPAVQAELRKWGVKMFLPAPMPQYQVMSTRRIAKIEDFKGARVRAGPEMRRILEEFGAASFLMQSAEAQAAMKSGALDTIVLPYPWVFAQYKIDDVAKYVTDNISLGSSFCYIGVSQKAWDALPPRMKDAMQSLRQPAIAQYEKIYAREDAENIAAFKRKGLEFVSFSRTDRARLLAKAINYWKAWVEEREKQGLKGREVFEFTQAKIRELTRK